MFLLKVILFRNLSNCLSKIKLKYSFAFYRADLCGCGCILNQVLLIIENNLLVHFTISMHNQVMAFGMDYFES